MKLHEYQAKDMFRKFGIPVPEGNIASSADEAANVAEMLAGPPWVVKAQVHAGGRGKGGGVKVEEKMRLVAPASSMASKRFRLVVRLCV